MDELAGRYLTLSLRLGRLRPGLVDSYTGPDRLLAAIHAEPRRSPDALAAEADRLVIDVAGEATLPRDRADWLTRQLLALRSVATLLKGETLAFDDRVRRLLDAEVPDADEPGRALLALVDTEFAGTGPIGDRVEAVLAGARVTPALAQRIFTAALTGTRDAARVRFHLPPDETVVHGDLGSPQDGTHDWPGAATRTSPIGAHGSRVEVAFTRPVTVREVVGAAIGAAYPGVHTERAVKTSLLVGQFGRGENAITVATTPQDVVASGAGRCAVDVLASEVDALVADLCADFGVPDGPEPDLQRALGRLADAATVAAVRASTADGDVGAVLEELSPEPAGRRRASASALRDPDRGLAALVPVLGRETVAEFLEKQSSPVEGYRRILTEQLTPSAMRERG